MTAAALPLTIQRRATHLMGVAPRLRSDPP